jgi:hypothetical protein
MPRAFTSADVVQADTGADVGATAPTISMAPTAEGNGGIIVISAQNVLAPPSQWHTLAAAGLSDVNVMLGIMCRADLPPGETTWVFNSVGGVSGNWTWIAEEWTNLSYAPMLGSARTNQLTSVGSISTGTTGTWDSTNYAVGIAAMWIYGASGAPAGWPTCTWSNGFTETDVLTIGTGSNIGDQELHVARRYGEAGDTGAWETTCTFHTTMTTKAAHACLAVLRAESLLGDI